MTEQTHARETMHRAVALSLLLHGFVLLIGQALPSWFPGRDAPPLMFVELTDLPMPLPPEPNPARVRSSASSASPSQPRNARSGSNRPGPARERWLDRLDAGLAKLQDARPADSRGRTASLATRQWESNRNPQPEDFPPGAPTESIASDRRYLGELERRVRLHGRPGAGAGGESEVATIIGGTGASEGTPLPAWIREMIRRKVRGYLPELEASYSSAMRRNRNIKGRLLVRFRIDPSGVVRHAELAERSGGDNAFGAAILERVRNWTFEPTGGITVEVLYPFVFVSPS